MKTRVPLWALLAILCAGTSILASCTPTRTRDASMYSSIFGTRKVAEPEKPAVPSPLINDYVLSQSNSGNTRVVVDIASQKGYLLVNDQIAIESPVSTARPGKYTPRGSFRMGQRVRTGKVSTIYGVEMPYWMRLNQTEFGMHAGYLPGYPASAGCIRFPYSAAQQIYDHTNGSTRVNIYSSWEGI